MKLDDEQRREVQESIAIWRDFLGPRQANVILTAPRKEALACLVALAEAVLAEPQPPSGA